MRFTLLGFLGALTVSSAYAQPTVDGSPCETAVMAARTVAEADASGAEALLDAVETACEAYRSGYPAGRTSLAPADAVARDVQYARVLADWASLRVLVRSDCRGALELLSDVAHALETLPVPAEAFARAAHLALTCRAAPPDVEMGAYVLSPSTAPVRVEDVVAGTEDASMRFGGACMGFVSSRAAAVFELAGDSVVSAAAFAPPESDLTIVLDGPGGPFCNDDYYGRDPAVQANLAAGRYHLYVGELYPTGYGTSFELILAAQPLAPVAFGSEPTHGSAEVTPGVLPSSLEGTSGGPVAARIYGPSCVGSVAATPNHRLVVPVEGRVTARVSARDGTDLTLVLASAGATYCNDDFDGFDPAISEWLSTGVYDVYVGDHFGEGARYEIHFSDENLHAIEAGRLTPMFGTAALSGATPVVSLGGVAQGTEDARARFGPPCTGYIGWEPNHTLYLDSEAAVWIDVTALDGADLTLVVAGESGTYCNDDFRGRDPGLAGVLATGTYDVYVGEFNTSPMGTAYGLRVSLTERAEPVASPTTPLVLAMAHDRQSFWGTTYGEVDAVSMSPDCVGLVPMHPSQRFELSTPSQVTVGARSGPFGDLVLAVRGPDGVFCNDDFDDLNPAVMGDWSPGTWEVFVGEYSGDTLGTPFAAWIEARPLGTFPEPPAPVEPPPVEPETIAVTLATGTVFQTGLSGGDLRGRAFGPSCVGYLPEVPNFEVTVGAAGIWEIAVLAGGDTTLVVDGPGGPFCNDDLNDFHPGVTVNLVPGTYRVFVGSYNPSLYHDFQISFRPVTTPVPTSAPLPTP